MHGLQGFTLIELLVVIAIIGILAAIGSWGYVRWARQMQVQGVARDMQARFSSLRSEGQRRSLHAEVEFITQDVYEARLINPRNNTVVSSQRYTVPPEIRVTALDGKSLIGSDVKVRWTAPYSQAPLDRAFKVDRGGNFKAFRVAVIGDRGQVVLSVL